MNLFYRFDTFLMNTAPRPKLKGIKRFFVEFLFLVWNKQGLAFLPHSALFLCPREGLFGLYRYDLLLLVAVILQAFMVFAKLESRNKLKAICFFHFFCFGDF